MMDKEKIIAALDAVSATRDILTDEQAAEVPDLFKPWEVGKSYKKGERITYDGVLYKIANDHTSQADWIPGSVPAIYAEVLPGQDGTAIGEWKQPTGNTNPYKLGDKVTYNGKTWECTGVDSNGNNVWEPGVYGWIEV